MSPVQYLFTQPHTSLFSESNLGQKSIYIIFFTIDQRSLKIISKSKEICHKTYTCRSDPLHVSLYINNVIKY